ncbi:heme biosynthesis HemY N-terminal domain-containing protein [Pseudogulbenkiania sp. MAI-1]|uniref:heme biosynthesis HemY N-terminal domain-containing protein n=1 Tax=Pseudogulbenkiania sp. MAI-1 TaxID=990370 RepID=UPI00045E8E10|nr:heme biosynthesis HemY N-terminal domain-containing protein [Pseudogulbenkiania sp. MAI-1]
MKFVLWITGLFALAVLVGLASTLNTGYAILFLPPYRLEVSFNLLIVAVILLIVVAHLVLRLIGLATGLPEEVRRFQRQKKLKAARHALREAGIAFFEGRFQRAEREAVRALADESAPENKALALLMAARSAAAMQDLEKRDGYLAQLDALPERLQLARHMLDAELKLEAKDTLGALSAIERARAISPNLTNALKLELKVRLLQKQPEAVLALTEKLLKAEALEPDRARRYRLAAYTQQLDGFAQGQEIRDWLRRVPEVERQNPVLVGRIVERLIVLGEADYAATLIAGALGDDEQATPELARELGQLAEHLSAEKRLELLKEAEGWLKQRPRDHLLLLALGRLALAQQLWGKAQSYLEASASIEPTLCAHAELSRLFTAIDKPELAERHYQQSLELALQQGC